MSPFKSPLLLTVPPTLEKKLEALAALRTLEAQDEELVRQRRVAIAALRRDFDELQRDFATLRHRLASDARWDVMRALKYNPDQPRVPAGQPAGGQWTSGGVDDVAGSPQINTGSSGDPSLSNPVADHSAVPINDPRVISDITPDNTWKPGAQYAANDIEIEIPANDNLTPEQLCRRAYALGVAKVAMTPGLSQGEYIDWRSQLTDALYLCLNLADGVRPPYPGGDFIWFRGVGMVIFKPGEPPRLVLLPTTTR
jgi:hypothetical protein